MAAVILGFSLTVWCFYPGYVGGDAAWQLIQGRTGKYTSWHPPLMAYVWSRFDNFIAGPAGMFLLHNILFWSGLGIIVSRSIRGWILPPLLILGIGLWPPIFVNLANVCKDMGMAASLLLACAMLLSVRQERKIWKFTLAIICLFYALGVRHNGAAAVLPLTVWAGIILYAWAFQKTRTSLLPKIILGLCVFLILIIGARTVDRMLLPDELYPDMLSPLATPLQQTLVFDLIAISIKKNEVLLPVHLSPPEDPFTIEQLKKIYHPESVWRVFWGVEDLRKIPFSIGLDQHEMLYEKWKEVVKSNLDIYLPHRLRLFLGSLGINRKSVKYPFETPQRIALIKIDYNTHRFTDFIFARATAIQNSLVFRVWTYLIVMITFLSLSIWKNSMNTLPVLILGTSAFLYILPYFFVDVEGDFRYHIWTVYTAFMIPVLFFGGQVKTREFRKSIRSLSHQNNDDMTFAKFCKMEG